MSSFIHILIYLNTLGTSMRFVTAWLELIYILHSSKACLITSIFSSNCS